MKKEIRATLSPALFLFLLNLQTFPTLGQPIEFDLRLYRTPVSPGELHEDALFLKEVVQLIAKDIPISPVAVRGELAYESFDLRTDRAKAVARDGSIQFDDAGRPVFWVTPTIVIRGEVYKQVTRAYLKWRKAFELEWIRTARNATEELKPTPLQVLFNHPVLPRSEKIRETIRFYRLETLPRIPKPTPNPAYWPISPIIDLPESGVQVQFNLRGGQVTVLDSESSAVWVLPYPPELDPQRWIDLYKKEVRKVGKEKAAERLRREALAWGLPVLPPMPNEDRGTPRGERADKVFVE